MLLKYDTAPRTAISTYSHYNEFNLFCFAVCKKPAEETKQEAMHPSKAGEGQGPLVIQLAA